MHECSYSYIVMFPLYLCQQRHKPVDECNSSGQEFIPLSYGQSHSHSALNSTDNSSALLLLYSSALWFAFTPSIGSPHFSKCGLKNEVMIELEENHYPNALFGLSLRIITCTLSHGQPHRCRMRLMARIRYPKATIQVVADLPHRMRLSWLRCQLMRFRSVYVSKPHYASKRLWIRNY